MSATPAHIRLLYALVSATPAHIRLQTGIQPGQRQGGAALPFFLPVAGGNLTKRAAIFLDGAYMENILRQEFSGIRIDYQKLSAPLAGDGDLLRTYYYHSLPYQGNPPTEEERARYAIRRNFFTALDRLPRYTVRLGRLSPLGPDPEGRPRFAQKQVDILLGIDSGPAGGQTSDPGSHPGYRRQRLYPGRSRSQSRGRPGAPLSRRQSPQLPLAGSRRKSPVHPGFYQRPATLTPQPPSAHPELVEG